MFDSYLFRRGALALALLAAFVLLPPSLHAQSAQSVVEQARSTMIDMYGGVDHFMVKTNMHTAYSRVVMENGEMQMETQMGAMRGDASGASMGGSAFNSMSQLDALAQHGIYQGTESISGIDCHVIFLDDPSTMDAQLSSGDTATYYIGASDYLFRGMDMTMEDGTGVEMRMKDYQDYSGVMYPSRMEMTMVQSDEARQAQMREMQEQLEQMPEAMRERMQTQIEDAQSMIAGEPAVITTEEVVVNGPLPDGIFDN